MHYLQENQPLSPRFEEHTHYNDLMMHVVAVMMKKVIFIFQAFQKKEYILLDLKALLYGKQNLLSRLQVCYLDGVGSHILGSLHSWKRRMQPWMPLGRLGYKSAGCAFFSRSRLPRLILRATTKAIVFHSQSEDFLFLPQGICNIFNFVFISVQVWAGDIRPKTFGIW